MENIMCIHNLTKYYGNKKGVAGLNLDIKKGEIFGFIGPNGAGKSTTIRTALGILNPTGGSVEIFGKSLKENKTEILGRIGYMPSEPAFYDRMKVAEAIRFSASFYKKDCRSAAEELCDRLKLDTRKRIEELSLGNRKKVSIVCALQHDAELYILDEPTSGLDPLMQKEFFALLTEKNKAGATIFLSSHILSEIQRYCHRAAMIRDGELVVVDTMENICKKSAKRVTLQGVKEIRGLAVSDVQQQDNGISFLYRGDMKELLQNLSGLPIEDITITEPGLEEIFLHFYEGDKRDDNI